MGCSEDDSVGNSSIAYDNSSDEAPQGNADVKLIPGRRTEDSRPFRDVQTAKRLPAGGIVYNVLLPKPPKQPDASIKDAAKLAAEKEAFRLAYAV